MPKYRAEVVQVRRQITTLEVQADDLTTAIYRLHLLAAETPKEDWADLDYDYHIPCQPEVLHAQVPD
jgi:hypothetical protein